MIGQQNIDSLVARVPEHEQSKTVRAAMTVIFGVADRFATKVKDLSQDAGLTSIGRASKLREALPGFAAEMRMASAPIQRLRRRLGEQRAAIRVKEPDPTNLAAAIERMEIRTFLRGLEPMDRKTLLETTGDRRILEAAVSAAPELSGLRGIQRETAERVERRLLELTFPAELKAIDELEAVVAEGEAVIQVGRQSLRGDAELDERQFESIVGPAEREAMRPWLVDGGEGQMLVVEGKPGNATYRIATEWERQEGKRYANYAEYEAERKAAA